MSELSQNQGFTVEVTQEDIDKAIPANSGHCMVADAIKHSFLKRKGYKPLGVSVDIQTIRFTDKKNKVRRIYLTPAKAQKGLLQFDQGVPVKPFKFFVSPRNSQVLEAKRRPLSEEAVEQRRRASKKSAEARLVAKRRGTRGTTITKIGGKAPPKAVLTGNRRQFGVRAAGKLTDD